MRCIRTLIVCLVVVLLWLTALGTGAQATTVHCGTGDVPCLIAAIQAANASGATTTTIQLEAGTYTLVASDNDTDGPNGLPSVAGRVTLQGVGDALSQTVIARATTAPGFRLLHVAASGQLTVQGVALTGGSANIGGGVFNRGVLVLTQSALEQNVADSGGGLANLGGTVTLEDSYVFDNNAVHPGGGIYTVGGSVTIMGSALAANGGDGGGALEHVGDGEVTIVDSAIIDNVTGLGGGGTLSFYGGTLRLVNVTLARNTVYSGAPPGGGAIVSSGDVSLVNCTVVDNTSLAGHSPGGIAVTAGTLMLVNTILARNMGAFGEECRGTLTSLGHNLIGDPKGCPITLQPTDKTGDPGLGAFSDDGTPGNGHYPLVATSQAVNAGDPQACPLTDQLGQPRGGGCDLGAIEFAPVPADIVERSMRR